MCNTTQKVKKVYEEFSVEDFACSLEGFKYESDELIFESINFNSGLFSFEDEVIKCSIGNNKLKIFSKPNPQSTERIEYKNVKKFKFIDCKFSDDTYFKKGLDSLKFKNCVFEGRCYINNQYEDNNAQINIKNLEIKKTVFNKNFKLHNSIIDDFQIVDTDFIKNADFFKSEFKSGIDNIICFNTINFHELALFGNTKFNKFLKFKYVTFKGYTHFRSATFNEGLDLEYANIEKEMNFFNVHELSNNVSKKNTSQETYRIIKHQLQKVGNIIQSNKYQAFELEKRQHNVCNKYNFRSLLDCIVLNVHNISSSHSTNWLLALIWIIVIGILTTCFLEKDININNTIQYMSILNKYDEFKIDKTINYTIVMFNKIFLGYLYYQFVTAIRKDTRK